MIKITETDNVWNRKTFNLESVGMYDYEYQTPEIYKIDRKNVWFVITKMFDSQYGAACGYSF